MISLLYISNRPGSIDLLAHSLENQICKEYELVVVDGYPGRVERGKARDYLEKHGVRLGWYGPPKPKLYPDLPVNFAGAMNTALVHARHSHVVFVHDFTILPIDAVLQWHRSFTENGTKAIISGTARLFQAKTPDKEADISVWEWQPLSAITGPLICDWVPEIMEIFYTGAAIRFFESINGFDERGDAHITLPLQNLFALSHRMMYRLVVDRRLHQTMLNHRTWNGPTTWNWNPLEWKNAPEWKPWGNDGWCLRDERRQYLEAAK